MSFWTGFTTGLAGSVDRALQSAMEQDRNELSRAKRFWRERRAQKLDREQEKKEAYDEKAEKAYGFLADELGDATMAYAVMKKLGGADEALAYIDKVKAKRDTLQAGEVYNIRDDFVNYKPGETTLTRDQGMERVRYQIPSSVFAPVKQGDLGFESRIDKYFGREGQAAQQAASTLTKQFAAQAPERLEPLTGMGSIERVDRSRLLAAEQAADAATKKEREKKLFDIKVETFDMEKGLAELNKDKIEQQMELAEKANTMAEKRLALAEAESLRSQARLIQDAQAFVKDQMLTDLSIEEKEAARAKQKEFPEFTSYEGAAAFATAELARSELRYKREDLEKLRDDANEGQIKWNEEAGKTGKKKAPFSPASLNSIVDGAMDEELKNLPTENIEGRIERVFQGNEAKYLAGRQRGFKAIEARLGTYDKMEDGQLVEGTMPKEAQRYLKQLKRNDQDRALAYALGRRSQYDAAGANVRKKEQANFVPFNEVQGAVKKIKQNAPIGSAVDDQAALKMYGRTQLKEGQVLSVDPDSMTYLIWTGTRFIRANAKVD